MSAPSLPSLLVTSLLLLSCSPTSRDTPSPRTAERPLNQLTEREKAEGWRLLFDGVSTEGWRGVNAAAFPATGWEVRDGDTGTHGLGLEYQLLDNAHHEWMLSGRMTPNDFHTLGALYELYPPSPEKAPRSLGEWNQSRIVSRRGTVQHWLNGALVLEYDRESPDFLERVARSKFKEIDGFGRHEAGHILLQDHGSTVRFRNLKIRDLSNVE